MATVCRYIVVKVDASFATLASAEENCSQATTMVNPSSAPYTSPTQVKNGDSVELYSLATVWDDAIRQPHTASPDHYRRDEGNGQNQPQTGDPEVRHGAPPQVGRRPPVPACPRQYVLPSPSMPVDARASRATLQYLPKQIACHQPQQITHGTGTRDLLAAGNTLTGSGRWTVERATCVTLRRRSPMLSVTVTGGSRGANRVAYGRDTKGGPAGEKLEQMWKTHAMLPRIAVLSDPPITRWLGNSRPGLHVSVMTCWEHK